MKSTSICGEGSSSVRCSPFLAGASLRGTSRAKLACRDIKSAENIAVYVDAIPDKKFDAPTDQARH